MLAFGSQGAQPSDLGEQETSPYVDRVRPRCGQLEEVKVDERQGEDEKNRGKEGRIKE